MKLNFEILVFPKQCAKRGGRLQGHPGLCYSGEYHP